MNIGQNLKYLRGKKQLTVKQLQAKTGISYHTLSAYERNLIKPTIENCYKICKVLEAPMEALIMGENTEYEFKDHELKKYFSRIEEMTETDRSRIKMLIKKYIKIKDDFDELIEEMEKGEGKK